MRCVGGGNSTWLSVAPQAAAVTPYLDQSRATAGQDSWRWDSGERGMIKGTLKT